MVRLGPIVMVLGLAGCSALRDAFSGDPQVAGTAAGQTLTVDRLANMVGRAQRIPVRPDVLTGVANAYLDHAGEHVGSDGNALRASKDRKSTRLNSSHPPTPYA